MFVVRRKAAQEILRSMELGDADGMGLRIAASRGSDQGVNYRMGFDERAPGDLVIQTNGVEVLIAQEHRTLLEGAELEFAELDDGKRDFIFLNPNDPHYQAPEEGDSAPAERDA